MTFTGRELLIAPFSQDGEDEIDSLPSKRARSWKAYWEQEVKGSPLLGSFNVICCVVGVGLLGLPYALSQSGWIGVPLLILTCWMSTFTSAILGDVIHVTDGATSFGDLGEAAYGATGRWLVAVQQYMTMIGVASIFLVVLASGMKQVLPETFPDCNNNIATIGLVVSFHIFFHKLNEVAVLSAFNLLVAISITLVVCWQSVQGALPDAHSVLMNTVHSDAYNYQFLIAFPTIAFAFGCHTIIPAIHDELRDKSTFKPMCYISMPTTLLMYLPVAMIGYWAFGDKVEDPIFKNFTGSTINVVIVLLLAHVTMSYAIIMNPPELAFEEQVVKVLSGWAQDPTVRVVLHNRWPLRMFLRLLVTALTVLIARAVPCFPILLSLVSSITGTTTSFVFPVLFYCRLVPNIPRRQHIFCRAILFFSVAGGVSGAYNAVLGLKGCHLANAGC